MTAPLFSPAMVGLLLITAGLLGYVFGSTKLTQRHEDMVAWMVGENRRIATAVRYLYTAAQLTYPDHLENEPDYGPTFWQRIKARVRRPEKPHTVTSTPPKVTGPAKAPQAATEPTTVRARYLPPPCTCDLERYGGHAEDCHTQAPAAQPAAEPADEREPKACPRCGQMCHYDGWDHVHPNGIGIGSCSTEPTTAPIRMPDPGGEPTRPDMRQARNVPPPERSLAQILAEFEKARADVQTAQTKGNK
jgi:hypothetical protein